MNDANLDLRLQDQEGTHDAELEQAWQALSKLLVLRMTDSVRQKILFHLPKLLFLLILDMSQAVQQRRVHIPAITIAAAAALGASAIKTYNSYDAHQTTIIAFVKKYEADFAGLLWDIMDAADPDDAELFSHLESIARNAKNRCIELP